MTKAAQFANLQYKRYQRITYVGKPNVPNMIEADQCVKWLNFRIDK